MIRIPHLFLLLSFLMISPSGFCEEEEYGWSNAGTYSEDEEKAKSKNEHGVISQPGGQLVSRFWIGTATLGAFGSLFCLSNAKCRAFVHEKFWGESRPAPALHPSLAHVERVNFASPEKCQEFARQAADGRRIRNWGSIAPNKLNDYIGQLKAIAAESGYPMPGTPQ